MALVIGIQTRANASRRVGYYALPTLRACVMLRPLGRQPLLVFSGSTLG